MMPLGMSDPSPAIDARLFEPFWQSRTMHAESLFFVESGTGAAAARLLFDWPEDLLLTSATGEVAFEEGRDYAVARESGVLTLTADSRIPSCSYGDLYLPADPFVLIGDGDEFHRRQVAATYRHAQGAWSGYVPRLAEGQLPRTRARLAASQPLTLCVAGDSISEGYNASGFTGAPPYQPPYVELVAAGLGHAGASPVDLRNLAVAGWTSDDGAADAERLTHPRPDLVIVAFGMNDAGYNDAAGFAANVGAIVTTVQAASPDAEFVLVSPMLPNPRWPYPVLDRFPAYRDALADMCGDGAALADLTRMWTDLLARKSVHDLTGNGINHPNDFGHRVYAQVILALLIGDPVSVRT
jgi:lysophospholipase L1-like esterase